MAKVDKSEVDYSKGMLHSHCGPTFHDDKYYCQHYIPSRTQIGACDRVSGPIEVSHWCQLYKRIKK